MHKGHPTVIKLAAKAECDPRTAAKWLNGWHIRVHATRARLEAATKALGLETMRAEAVKNPTLGAA